jgi:hypothetical protein
MVAFIRLTVRIAGSAELSRLSCSPRRNAHGSVRVETRTEALRRKLAEEAIAELLRERAGIEVVVAEGIDTDELGTFTSDVERVGSMLETPIIQFPIG